MSHAGIINYQGQNLKLYYGYTIIVVIDSVTIPYMYHFSNYSITLLMQLVNELC